MGPESHAVSLQDTAFQSHQAATLSSPKGGAFSSEPSFTPLGYFTTNAPLLCENHIWKSWFGWSGAWWTIFSRWNTQKHPQIPHCINDPSIYRQILKMPAVWWIEHTPLTLVLLLYPSASILRGHRQQIQMIAYLAQENNPMPVKCQLATHQGPFISKWSKLLSIFLHHINIRNYCILSY